jgi:ABC-type glycerol-3-phosphate transport system substrate-binding protein
MRRSIVIALAAGLALTACSQKTQESAASAAAGAVSDTASNVDVASSAVSNAVSDIGSEADESSASSGTTTQPD